MPHYAVVAITANNQGGARGLYHYAIPDALTDLTPGHLVEVAFGTARTVGIVVALDDTSPVPTTKPILARLDPNPVVTPLQLELARWLADHTLAPLGACLALMLPAGISQRGDKLYTLIDEPDFSDQESARTAIAAQVVGLLKTRGSLRGAQIEHALRGTDWRNAIAGWIESGAIQREAILNPPSVGGKHTRVAQLAIAPDQVDSIVEALPRKASARRAKILLYLRDQVDQPIDTAELIANTRTDSGALKLTVEAGWVTLHDADSWRDPLAGRAFVAANPPLLTPDQDAAWKQIAPSIAARSTDVFLLHGVTGSGKTEIYLRAIDLAIKRGRGAIALVPEIALVPQTVRRFMARFPDRVALSHSGLTDGQQFDTWRRARSGAFDLVIGARSALFTPLLDVGIIILDEEHDSSYKQSPPLPPPYYHTRDAAIALAKLHGCPVILGSATPDLVTRWQADQGTIAYIHLPDRILAHREQIAEQAAADPVDPLMEDAIDQAANRPVTITTPRRFTAADAPDALYAPLPPVRIVDMRSELKAGNRSVFSRLLQGSLAETLDRGEQALLYLNRRGTATSVVCRDCGYLARCPHCDMPITYHDRESRLTCHSCGFHAKPPTVCPDCGSTRIRFFGLGTERLQEEVKQAFPNARIDRWDRDTVKERGAHEAILDRFLSGESNVLIGTQMIAKGLDLPRVTLVGVILADTTLGLPDYRAGERAFQLLTQVVGRSGRSWRGGSAIIQTYQPAHYAVRASATHDYPGFYARELAYRHDLGYPPFARLGRVLFRSEHSDKARLAAEQTADKLRAILMNTPIDARLVGPAPAFFGKMADVYRWQIILVVKGADPAIVLRQIDPALGMFIDLDPVDIL